MDSIGNAPTSLSLDTHSISGSTVNTGSAYSLAAYRTANPGKIILLSFVDIARSTWLKNLADLSKNASINSNFKVFIVLFKLSGASFSSSFGAVDVPAAVSSAGCSLSDFDDIPLTKDDAAVASARLDWIKTDSAGGYTNLSDGTIPPMWTYLIDEAGCISDKWHTLATVVNTAHAAADPISFSHLPGTFDSSDYSSNETFTALRIKNLHDALKIIKGDPVNGTIVHTPAGIKRIIFSRPLTQASAQTASNYELSGGGVSGGGPDDADGADYSGADRTENAVALSFNNTSLIDSCVNETVLEIDSGGSLADTSGTPYADSGIISYLTEPATAGPILEAGVILSDGSGTDTRIHYLKTGSSACVMSADRRLTIRILTDNPGSAKPVARLVKPLGTEVELSFKGLVSEEIDQSVLDEYGSYSLEIDPYTDKSGTTLTASEYSFGIVDPSILLTPVTDSLEGWGYFPREEGLPENCPEGNNPGFTGPDGLSNVPAWNGTGTAAVSAAGGQALFISKNGADPMNMVYQRDYGCILKNNAGGGNWDAPAYIEAALNCPEDSSSDILKITDLSDSASPACGIGILSNGAGVRLQNGPYIAELSLVNVQDAGAVHTGYRLALELHSNIPDQRAFAFSDTAIDWNSWTGFHLLKLAKEVDGSGSVYRVYLDGAVVAGLEINEKRLPAVSFDAYPGTAAAAFGVFSDYNQDVTASFDFIRYAFYDSRYEIGAYSNALKLEFPHLRRDSSPADADFFRSSDILLNGSGTADPVFGQINTINVAARITKTAAGNLALKNIPVKIRFCAADFDDSSPDVINGFTNNTAFPAYGEPSLQPLTNSGVSSAALTIGSADSLADTDTIEWQTEADRDRLARRLFILVCADAPLLDSPALCAGAPGTEYFDNTVNASDERTGDSRSVIRQFLPDFYVRDTLADNGVLNPGGWLSPDIAIGVFAGGTAGSCSLPDPQGTAEPLYPAGFARGVDNAVYSPDGYTGIDSNIAGESIKITDTGWSDYGSQCYYNRIWVRLSNRGIVPGPANVQVFFLGSVLRAAFDPAQARGGAYEKIWADNPPTNYVQTMFQRYTAAGGGFNIDIVEALPPLCGASDWRSPAEYLIAEFLWHVNEADVPANVSDNHGCNAVTINLPGQPSWMSGVDSSPAINPADSVWAANSLTNNITVRNSNIAVGQPPATDDVTNKSAIDSNDDPVNYKKLLNNFKPVFSKKHTYWSLAVDTKKMPGSEIILRLPQWIAAGAKLVGFREFGLTGKTGRLKLIGGKPESFRKYRYFILRNGLEGRINGICNIFNMPHFKRYMSEKTVNLYYRLNSGVKPGNYSIEIKQLARGRVVGGYSTVVIVPGGQKIDLIADERIKAVFDAKKYPEVLLAVPYAKRQPMGGIDMALRRRYRLAPRLLKRDLRNKRQSLINGVEKPELNRKKDIVAAAVGRVLDRSGGIAEALVELCTEDGRLLASARTDDNGCYLFTLDPENNKQKYPPVAQSGIILCLRAFKTIGKKKIPLGSVTRKIEDPFFAMPDLRYRKQDDRPRKNIRFTQGGEKEETENKKPW